MNKFLLAALLVLSCFTVSAQPWMPQAGGRVKYDDAVAYYEQYIAPTIEDREEDDHDKEMAEGEEEDERYQFDRWCWYWKNHLDADGYMVSRGQAAKNWNEYLASRKGAWKTTASSDWSFVGPDYTTSGYTGLGRINAIAFDPIDSGTIYVGSASGGPWKTTNSGATWTCLYDNLASLCVSAICVNPLNHNTVYVMTGDADGGSDYSVGVFKSVDAGLHWTNVGPSWTPDSFNMARSLVINPIDTSTLLLATSAGMFRTGNAGASWTRVSTLNFRQVLFCPADTAVVYSTTQGSGAQVLRSPDGGVTWTPVTTLSGARRIALAVCPADPSLVMALASNSNSGLLGVYKSLDYGISFLPTFTDDASCSNNILSGDIGLPATSCNGQAWYDLCIAVDPADPAKVMVGGVNNYKSVDGGSSWTLANQWYNTGSGIPIVHADKHWLGYNPLNHALYLGCDGGIYRTSNFGSLWTDLTNGMGITQFYRNAVDNGVAFCLGGAQDNGSKQVEGSTVTNLTGGDGMNCLINYSNPSFEFYTATQNGHINMTVDGGISFFSISDDLPTPGAWITPYILHPTDPFTLFAGYKAVYATHDGGSTWAAISPSFSGSVNIEVLEAAPSDGNYIYAVRSYGSRSKIHYTSDGGTTWDTVRNVPAHTYITDLKVDPDTPANIWITVGGYIDGEKVFAYSAATDTWTNESSLLPNLPVKCIAVDTFSGTRYIGTDAAVFYKTKSMSAWALFNTNLPAVHVDDLGINHATSEIWAATYGRGMWKSPKAEVTPFVGVVDPATWASGIRVAPNPCRGNCNIIAGDPSLRGKPVHVSLFSANGRELQSYSGVFSAGGNLGLDVSGLAPGFYICEISGPGGRAHAKVLVGSN